MRCLLPPARKRPLKATHLEKYEQQLLWDEVSRNNEIEWTTEMALRWKDKLNWNLFSRCAHGQVVTAEGIEALAPLWDWKALTANPNVRMTNELVRKYIAKYAMPYDIEFRDELPKTLVGKVAYRVLEEEEAKKREQQKG